MTANLIILDAAERVFGEHGFEGASMRQIANAAGVAQSLLHYHHKDKLSLFDAVFRRRADQIAERRGALLDELIASTPDRSEDGLTRVLEILLTPLDALLEIEGRQLHAYLQMLAETTLSSSERAVAIMQRLYDPSAARFVTAFKAAVPALDHEQAVWCYLFAIGARMQAHSPAGRAERLGADPARIDRPYEMLVPFIAAGIRAVTEMPLACSRGSGGARDSPVEASVRNACLRVAPVGGMLAPSHGSIADRHVASGSVESPDDLREG